VQLLLEAVEQLLVEGLLVLDLDPLLEISLQFLQDRLCLLDVVQAGALEEYLHLFLDQDEGLERSLLAEVADVEGLVEAEVQLPLLEEEQDEQLLWAQLVPCLAVAPYDLPRLLLVLQDRHRYHHRPPHELVRLQVVNHLLLVYHPPRLLGDQKGLEEHAEQLRQLPDLLLALLDELLDEYRDRVD
jgi:hypothetical protein